MLKKNFKKPFTSGQEYQLSTLTVIRSHDNKGKIKWYKNWKKGSNVLFSILRFPTDKFIDIIGEFNKVEETTNKKKTQKKNGQRI